MKIIAVLNREASITQCPISGIDVLKEVVQGQGASTSTTMYTYYPSSGNKSPSKKDQLKQVDSPDGLDVELSYP